MHAAHSMRVSLLMHKVRRSVLDYFTLDADEAMIAQSIVNLKFIEEEMRETRAFANAALLAYLEENGDLTIGETRHYIGRKITEKCLNTEAALESAFTLTAGDIARVALLLSSSAWRPGACEVELGKDWRELHFKRTEESDPKTGKPRRVVKQVDERYQKQLKGAG